jgi:hypothetical protein
VPSAHAQLPEGEGEAGGSEGAPEPDRPILLAEIDRALDESAGVTASSGAVAVRAWRDELTGALEALQYARGVLADDVAILRHRLASGAPSNKEVVDDLPGVLAARSTGQGSSAPEHLDSGTELDPGVFARSEALVAAHTEMAGVDLTSPEDVRRALGHLEDQVAALVTREGAVEARLGEIRAAIIRQYEEGAIPEPNWLG